MDEHRFQRGDRVVVSDERHPHHGKQGAVVYVARGREGWLYQVDGLERRMPIFTGAQLTRVVRQPISDLGRQAGNIILEAARKAREAEAKWHAE